MIVLYFRFSKGRSLTIIPQGILSLPAETITLLLCNMASNNESQKIEV